MRSHCSYLTDGLLETLQVVATAVVGLFANLIFFTTLLWTVARWLGVRHRQPALRVPEECTPGLAAEAAEGAGCFDQVGLTGQAGWALAAGGIALAGVALGMFVRMFQPGWPLRHSLRRLAVVLVVAGAALGLVTVVLPELIVFTQRPGRPAADRAGQRGDRRRLVERQGRRQPGLHRHGGRRGHGRRPGGAGGGRCARWRGPARGRCPRRPTGPPACRVACAGWPTWCSAAWSGRWRWPRRCSSSTAAPRRLGPAVPSWWCGR